MKFPIETAAQLGPLVRAVRKAQGLRQDDAAASMGVSENFLGKVERGGQTVQWGKLFQVLQELGMHVHIDVPDALAEQLQPGKGK